MDAKNIDLILCVHTGMVLPFEPVTLTFENVKYYVDTPKVYMFKIIV